MDKKVGRNDPCPCGSGKKFKKCCEERLAKKKFNAQILHAGKEPGADEKQVTGKATKISSNFFQKITAPKPKQPQHQPPHDHPDVEMPM